MISILGKNLITSSVSLAIMTLFEMLSHVSRWKKLRPNPVW
jgi:hypothetical protein